MFIISSWEESPVSTSIETFPISKATFPRVTVCPPKGTNTGLNYDLEKADNATIDDTVRKELVDIAAVLLQDKEYNEVIF